MAIPQCAISRKKRLAAFIEGLRGAAQRSLENVLGSLYEYTLFNLLESLDEDHSYVEQVDFVQQLAYDKFSQHYVSKALSGNHEPPSFGYKTLIFKKDSLFYPTRHLDWAIGCHIGQSSFFLPHQERTWIFINETDRILTYVQEGKKFENFWEFYDAVRSEELKKYLIKTVLPYVS